MNNQPAAAEGLETNLIEENVKLQQQQAANGEPVPSTSTAGNGIDIERNKQSTKHRHHHHHHHHRKHRQVSSKLQDDTGSSSEVIMDQTVTSETAETPPESPPLPPPPAPEVLSTIEESTPTPPPLPITALTAPSDDGHSVSRTNSIGSVPELHSGGKSQQQPKTLHPHQQRRHFSLFGNALTFGFDASSHRRHNSVVQRKNSTTAEKVKPSSSTTGITKVICDSPTSTTTTTSESYQLSELPPLPAKLATLNKPTNQALLATALRSRKARHSIDVRALPSYLAGKRQSTTFGQFLSGKSRDFFPLHDEEKIFS